MLLKIKQRKASSYKPKREKQTRIERKLSIKYVKLRTAKKYKSIKIVKIKTIKDKIINNYKTTIIKIIKTINKQ